MPHVSIVPMIKASPKVQDVYHEFYSQMDFPSPPNFIMTQGHSPTVARGTWDLVRRVLVEGEIARWKKEIIFIAISNDRGCRYCTAAHIACCRALGVESKTLEQVVNDINSIPDVKLRGMTGFAVKCARNPQSLTKADFAALRKCGHAESEIVEIIAMSAFAVYANIIADATRMDPDEMFDSIGKDQPKKPVRKGQRRAQVQV